MDAFQKGWFSEINPLWPGQCLSLRVEKLLYKHQSEFQQIQVVQTANHGRALILDDIIQCTEHDEFAYQEMISFLPLFSHPNPARVLIVGGGDGGVAREVAKHPHVQQIVQVEIDGHVIEAAKRHLPFMACGFDSPKLHLVVGDGFEYMRQHSAEFDVIITDSSDPIGPAANLFSESYFQLLARALKPGGVVCSQSGDPWTSLDHIKSTLGACQKYFRKVQLAVVNVPTYPSGTIALTLACLDDSSRQFEQPALVLSDDQVQEMALKFYNSAVHRAAFALPNFISIKIAH